MNYGESLPGPGAAFDEERREMFRDYLREQGGAASFAESVRASYLKSNEDFQLFEGWGMVAGLTRAQLERREMETDEPRVFIDGFFIGFAASLSKEPTIAEDAFTESMTMTRERVLASGQTDSEPHLSWGQAILEMSEQSIREHQGAEPLLEEVVIDAIEIERKKLYCSRTAIYERRFPTLRGGFGLGLQVVTHAAFISRLSENNDWDKAFRELDGG